MTKLRAFLLVLFLALLVPTARAADDDRAGDRVALKRCFEAWGKTPFESAEKAPYETIGTSVKILGIGKGVTDETRTEKPKLVLVKPAVNVLTKHTFRLLNPNGWYCLKSNVTVLGKAKIVAHCKAHVASTKEGVTVAGGNEGTEGVTVLGKAVLERVECEETKADESKSEEKKSEEKKSEP